MLAAWTLVFLSCTNPVESPLSGIVKSVTATAYFNYLNATEIPIKFQAFITGKDANVAPSFITVDYSEYPATQVELFYSYYDDGFGFVVAEYEGNYKIDSEKTYVCTVHMTTPTDQFDKRIPIESGLDF